MQLYPQGTCYNPFVPLPWDKPLLSCWVYLNWSEWTQIGYWRQHCYWYCPLPSFSLPSSLPQSPSIEGRALTPHSSCKKTKHPVKLCISLHHSNEDFFFSFQILATPAMPPLCKSVHHSLSYMDHSGMQSCETVVFLHWLLDFPYAGLLQVYFHALCSFFLQCFYPCRYSLSLSALLAPGILAVLSTS